jgi:hypothetical protein
MKKGMLKAVAIFEIATGLLGLAWFVGGLIGFLPHELVSKLWYGIFPLFSVCVGVLFWLQWRTALTLSYFVLLLQALIIYINGFSLDLRGPVNLTVSGIWNAKAGSDGAVIGINLVAMGVLVLLLFCQSAFQGLPLALVFRRKPTGNK